MYKLNEIKSQNNMISVHYRDNILTMYNMISVHYRDNSLTMYNIKTLKLY